MNKLIILIILICLPQIGLSKQIFCENSMYVEKEIMNVKNILINGVLGLRDSVIAYPIKIQYSGNFIKGYKSTLDVIWNDVFNKKTIKTLTEADNCQTVKYLGIKIRNGHYKATQLVFIFDKQDLRYSYSSISSAKELITFLIDSNRLANVEPNKLSELFLYPFPIYLNESVITIKNECDFLKNINVIVTPAFKAILKRGLSESNFKLHPIGILLDNIGTLWVAENKKGEFKFMMNGSHVKP